MRVGMAGVRMAEVSLASVAVIMGMAVVVAIVLMIMIMIVGVAAHDAHSTRPGDTNHTEWRSSGQFDTPLAGMH